MHPGSCSCGYHLANALSVTGVIWECAGDLFCSFVCATLDARGGAGASPEEPRRIVRARRRR